MTYEEAKRLAYRKLAMRSFYSKELAEQLIERGATSDVAQTVIKELTTLGYLNDREWIEGTIRSLLRRKYGPKAIAYKLSMKGIPEDEFSEFIEKTAENQSEQITLLLESKYRLRDLTDFKERQKVIAAVLRKGFSLSEVIKVIEKKNKEC